jgi:hypothetical protein
MKFPSLAIAIATFTIAARAAELPEGIWGKWSFEEDATIREWLTRGKNDEERAQIQKRANALKLVRQKLGKSVLGYIEISGSQIVAHEGFVNPRFDLLSVETERDSVVVRARHFQVPDDDNPREVLLRIKANGDIMVFELWDAGELQMLYVLKKKNA